MQIAQEFHLKVVLNHVTHGQEILDKIASYKVPVIVGPIYDFPLANERYDAVYTLPAELQKRGVKIAFSSAGDESGNPAASSATCHTPLDMRSPMACLTTKRSRPSPSTPPRFGAWPTS